MWFTLQLIETGRNVFSQWRFCQPIYILSSLNVDDPAQWFDLSEGGSDDIILKPEFRNLMEQLATLKMSGGWGEGGKSKTTILSQIL